MEENRNEFTFIWKIENFSVSILGKSFTSPNFIGPTMGGPESEFRLHLRVNYELFNNLVACFITGPDRFELDYELSFLSGDGTILKSKMFLKKVIKHDRYNLACVLCTKINDVFVLRKNRFISNDTFIIRCRIWKSEESIAQVKRCLVTTQCKPDCQIVIGSIKKFSCIRSISKYPLNIKSPLEISSISVSLSVIKDSILCIEIKHEVSFYKCKIFILDKYEKKVKSGQSENTHKSSSDITIPLIFSKDYLMKHKEYFLPDDELTIHCEIFHLGPDIDEIEYIFDCEDTQLKNTDLSSDEYLTENLSTLTNDWISMFKEGILCDAKLKTATETFPVHTVVLSARSPEFKSMFTNDMKEKTNHLVDIDDLDAATVRQMILFMYSDVLDDLEYESAKRLYFAAVKYNIVSLRQRCSNFLKQNLLQSNCLDILLLADKHQDKDLKYAVQSCIAKNDEAILFSEEWKNLEENHSRLTIEVFRFIYLKNQKK